jgi:hypothetical protein
MDKHSVESAYLKIDGIDFSSIRFKLMHQEHGCSWSSEKTKQAEALYKGYLALLLAYRSEGIVLAPPQIADEYWHHHILDTKKYFRDCESIFGEYLHHFPYFGLRSEEDANDLKDSGELTHKLLRQHFRDHPDFLCAFDCLTPGDCNNCSGSCSTCKAEDLRLASYSA